MTSKTSMTGTILAIIGLLLPSFLLLWTGGESVTLILAAGYLFLWGYFDLDLGWLGSVDDSGFHLFNLNWYLNPDDIAQGGSELIDLYLNVLATAIYPGDFGQADLDLSGMLFGLSLLIIIVGIIFGFLRKEDPRISGVLFIIGGIVALAAILLIWHNATNLSFIGGGVEDNFIPIPFGSLIILGAGILNFTKS